MSFSEWLKKKYQPRTTIGHEMKLLLLESELDFETWEGLYDFLKHTRKAPLRQINGARTVWASYKYYANGRQKWHRS